MAVIILCLALIAAALLLRRRKQAVAAVLSSAPTAKQMAEADFHVARFQSALIDPKPEKREELERNLAYWQAVQKANELR